MQTRYKATVLAALILMCTTVAGAQAVDQNDLERCAAEATAERKLACYEALTSAGVRTEAAQPEVGVNDAAAGGLARETPLAQGTPLAPNPAPESVSAPAQSAAVPARNSPSRDAQTDLSAATTTPTVSDGLGSEQLNSQKDMPEVVTATVVSVTRGRFDTLYFHFENGQVWRQIQPRRFRYPKDGEFKVTIGTGIMGDYQLRVEGDGPMTRIRRIR